MTLKTSHILRKLHPISNEAFPTYIAFNCVLSKKKKWGLFSVVRAWNELFYFMA